MSERLIRFAEESDAPSIARVHVRSWQEAYRGQVPDSYLDGLSVQDRERSWKKGLAKGNTVLVAEIDNQIIGFSGFGQARDDGESEHTIGEVYAIYLLEKYWDQGIGRKLLERSMSSLASVGCSSVVLWVLESNQRARAFYEKFGYRVDGHEETGNRGGVEMKEIRYSLHLEE